MTARLKISTKSLFRLAAVLVLLAVPGLAGDTAAPKPFSRAEATAIIANARKIVTPNGIERLERVRIGGIDQRVSIRSRDKRNPVLLFIHGGPGYVSMPMSWWFSRDWEEYFTEFNGISAAPARRCRRRAASPIRR